MLKDVTTLSRAVLKRDRTIPVAAPVVSALRAVGHAGGLARGSVCCVTGPVRVSFTAAAFAPANAAGSWVMWCSSSAPNCRALLDAGWSLERFVWVNPTGQWSACVGAGLGEFEVVVTQLPTGVSPREVQHASAIARRRNGVLVVLADRVPTALSADLVFDARGATWTSVGAGHLVSQETHVVMGGRRAPQPHVFSVVLGAS